MGKALRPSGKGLTRTDRTTTRGKVRAQKRTQRRVAFAGTSMPTKTFGKSIKSARKKVRKRKIQMARLGQ